jgi:hypothetical protein
MGFLVTGSQYNTIPWGTLDSMYGRIEWYSFSKQAATIQACVTLFTNAKSAKSNQQIIFSENPNIHGDVVATTLEFNDTTVTYPTSFTIPLTSSAMVRVPTYTNHITSESMSYYDFDDNGDVVEKVKWEYTSQSLETGYNMIEMDVVDVEQLSTNIYPFMYNIITSEFKQIFGEDNIINN